MIDVDADGVDGDALVRHIAEQFRRRRAGVAVAHENDLLDLRPVGEHVARLADVGLVAAGITDVDELLDQVVLGRVIARRLELGQRFGRAVREADEVVR
ncbi:MAG: hypothetical protein E6J14_14980 [Chloroflexi bacterium]|nr:MAG: hypothetical protein E6J14_14980 [Chloroflexota bacterium]